MVREGTRVNSMLFSLRSCLLGSWSFYACVFVLERLAWQLKALAALVEGRVEFPARRQLTAICNSSPRGSEARALLRNPVSKNQGEWGLIT